MILIIWNSGKAKECALAIEHAMQEAVQLASSLHDGVERLRSGEFSAVVVDQWITEAEPEPTSVLFDHLGMAVPLFLGGGAGPLLPAWVWSAVKTLAVLAVLVWARRRLPTIRADRYAELAWVVLIPLTIVQALVVSLVVLTRGGVPL